MPLVLGVLGSAIAWSKLRDSEDPELLKWIMIFGAVQTVALAFGSMSVPDGNMMIMDNPEYMMMDSGSTMNSEDGMVMEQP